MRGFYAVRYDLVSLKKIPVLKSTHLNNVRHKCAWSTLQAKVASVSKAFYKDNQKSHFRRFYFVPRGIADEYLHYGYGCTVIEFSYNYDTAYQLIFQTKTTESISKDQVHPFASARWFADMQFHTPFLAPGLKILK